MIESDRTLPTPPVEWRIQMRLRCASVCGYALPARITNGLSELGDVSLLQLYIHLAGWGKVEELGDVVRTTYERTQVGAAYKKFYAALLASRRDGRVPSDRLAWIVPDGYLDSASRVTITSDRDRLVTEIGREFGAIEIAADIFEWLPWTSLAIVACLRRWRSPRINGIRRALFKLVTDLDSAAAAFSPWEPEFNEDVRIIPVQALYQYEETKLMQDSLKQFEEGVALLRRRPRGLVRGGM